MIKCVICSDKAHGVHFGVNSCRACAAFFRRSIIYERKYKCRFDNNCDVNKGVRCVCRCCRLKKCLDEGMDAKVLEKHPPSNKTIGSPPGSEMETTVVYPVQTTVHPVVQPFAIPNSSSAFVPVNRNIGLQPIQDSNLTIEDEKSYTLLTKCPPKQLLPSNDTLLHFPLPSQSNFVSNVINNLNLGALFGAELPRLPVANADPTPVINEIFRGYRKLCSLRKATERLTETTQSQKLFDLIEGTTEMTEAKFDEHLTLIKHDFPLVSEMLSEHFSPFGNFSTETKWTMIRNFYPAFVLAERGFITSQIISNKDDDRVFFSRRLYAHLSNMPNFFTVKECKSSPEDVAQVFASTFMNIRRHVIDVFFDLAITEQELCALMGILLWNDCNQCLNLLV
uniref:Nuclear receptor domain-containing protein n=1 Tax=Acrobeloides nanus TaxID=290746 RepID=A0A914BZD3_9BILA